MKTKYKITILITLLTAFFLSGCSNSNVTNITFDADKFKNQDGIELDNDKVIITAGGEYNLSGEYSDVQIVIDCNDDVTLIFDNLQITNTDKHAIKIKSDNTVTIISKGREQNKILVGSEKNCIKSDGTLIFNGETELYLQGYECIKSKKLNIDAMMHINAFDDGIKTDEVRFVGGLTSINAVSDGIHTDNLYFDSGSLTITGLGDETFGIYAEKDVYINDGSLIINTAKDAISADNSVNINGGSVSIMTDDDGIHADKSVYIKDGHITIAWCLEGIESSMINISGGKTEIYSQNDGLNAANDDKDDDKPADVNISGGSVIIDADGDGIDANGSIFINGGEVFVSGAYGGDNNAIDFDDEFIINGGTLLAVGNNLNAKPPSKDSLQNSVMIIYDESTFWDHAQLIKDADDDFLIAGQFKKSYDNLIYSSSDLIEGQSYYYTSFQPFFSDSFFVVKPNSLDNYISSEKLAEYNDEFSEFFVTSNVTLVWDKK